MFSRQKYVKDNQPKVCKRSPTDLGKSKVMQKVRKTYETTPKKPMNKRTNGTEFTVRALSSKPGVTLLNLIMQQMIREFTSHSLI